MMNRVLKIKKFRDIKTGTQLFLGFGVVITLMLALSLVAWQQTSKLAMQTENLYSHPLQVRRALGKFETAITAIQRDMRELMLTNGDKEIEHLLTQIDISRAEAYRQLDILEKSYLGPLGDIKNMRTEFLKSNTQDDETVRLLRQGKINEALERTKPDGISGVQAQTLMKHTSVVDDFSRNKGDQFYNQSVQMKKELNNQLLLFAIAALLVSLVLAIFLSRLINNPLKELAGAMQSYRSGNKTVRSGYRSGNLFGKLSDSFNEMAGTLETENLISKRAAELSGIMLIEEEAHSFCHELLKNLLKHTDSQMGAVYLLNQDKSLFEVYACLGMDAEGRKPFSAINSEGEFGLALASRKISHIREIPADSRFSFATIPGSFKPREIITIPVFNGNQAMAIISLFSLQCYSDHTIRLLDSIFDTLTARMNGILAYKQIVEFSERLEEQNRELDAQKTELSSMADELKGQNAELEVQKQQLGEVSRLKTNFLSSMSHELRTPLNSVIALSGVLNRRLAKKIGEEEYSYLAVIERNGKHLLDLINEILDLSRIESGKVELEKTSFTINSLLTEVVAMIKPQSDQKGLMLNFTPDKKDAAIESDYNKCFHIFQNIVANAVKFTERGSVDISVSTQNGNVLVRVCDTGIGINKNDLHHIFDEFRQADGSNSRKFGGTGLGLSIAKKYSELIGCKISVESELGTGSVFSVSIPLKAGYVANEVLAISPEIIQERTPATVKEKSYGKTILIIEDSEAMVVQMADILEGEGYTVNAVKNGFDALDSLEKNIPDAVILDLMMPGMDGFEVLGKMRSNKLTVGLPVLVLTAKILETKDLEVIRNHHAHQLIQKGSITRDSLLEAIALMMWKKVEPAGINDIEVVPVTVAGKPRVLAVEDNPDNMLAIKAMIGERFEFIDACDGAQGIEKARKHIPHLILMDIAMPGMNGFEALREIRKNDELKHIPVIVVTSSAMRGDKNYFLEYGFNGYISKPVNADALFEEMYKWLLFVG